MRKPAIGAGDAMSESTKEDLIDTLQRLWSSDRDMSFLHGAEPKLLAGVIAETKRWQEQTLRAHSDVFEIMARATRYIPNFVLATMTGSLSPAVLARITELLEPKVAVSLSRSYPVLVLVEIWQLLEPAALGRIAREIDLATLTSILDALAQRGYTRRLTEVVETLDEVAVKRLVKGVRDPERLAAFAAHLTATATLASMARCVDERLLRVVAGVLQQRGLVSTARELVP